MILLRLIAALILLPVVGLLFLLAFVLFSVAPWGELLPREPGYWWTLAVVLLVFFVIPFAWHLWRELRSQSR